MDGKVEAPRKTSRIWVVICMISTAISITFLSQTGGVTNYFFPNSNAAEDSCAREFLELAAQQVGFLMLFVSFQSYAYSKGNTTKYQDLIAGGVAFIWVLVLGYTTFGRNKVADLGGDEFKFAVCICTCYGAFMTILAKHFTG